MSFIDSQGREIHGHVFAQPELDLHRYIPIAFDIRPQSPINLHVERYLMIHTTERVLQNEILWTESPLFFCHSSSRLVVGYYTTSCQKGDSC